MRITIEDNGRGIEPHHRSKLFEPLFSTKSFGVGLGLPLVSEIVGRHGGMTTVESDVGTSTRVQISLPLDRGQDRSEEARS